MAKKKDDGIIYRNCFACGNPMTVEDEDSWVIECVPCEVKEDGHATGKLKRKYYPIVFQWGGAWLVYVDHSKVYMPSP